MTSPSISAFHSSLLSTLSLSHAPHISSFAQSLQKQSDELDLLISTFLGGGEGRDVLRSPAKARGARVVEQIKVAERQGGNPFLAPQAQTSDLAENAQRQLQLQQQQMELAQKQKERDLQALKERQLQEQRVVQEAQAKAEAKANAKAQAEAAQLEADARVQAEAEAKVEAEAEVERAAREAEQRLQEEAQAQVEQERKAKQKAEALRAAQQAALEAQMQQLKQMREEQLRLKQEREKAEAELAREEQLAIQQEIWQAQLALEAERERAAAVQAEQARLEEERKRKAEQMRKVQLDDARRHLEARLLHANQQQAVASTSSLSAVEALKSPPAQRGGIPARPIQSEESLREAFNARKSLKKSLGHTLVPLSDVVVPPSNGESKNRVSWLSKSVMDAGPESRLSGQAPPISNTHHLQSINEQQQFKRTPVQQPYAANHIGHYTQMKSPTISTPAKELPTASTAIMNLRETMNKLKEGKISLAAQPVNAANALPLLVQPSTRPLNNREPSHPRDIGKTSSEEEEERKLAKLEQASALVRAGIARDQEVKRALALTEMKQASATMTAARPDTAGRKSSIDLANFNFDGSLDDAEQVFAHVTPVSVKDDVSDRIIKREASLKISSKSSNAASNSNSQFGFEQRMSEKVLQFEQKQEVKAKLVDESIRDRPIISNTVPDRSLQNQNAEAAPARTMLPQKANRPEDLKKHSGLSVNSDMQIAKESSHVTEFFDPPEEFAEKAGHDNIDDDMIIIDEDDSVQDVRVENDSDNSVNRMLLEFKQGDQAVQNHLNTVPAFANPPIKKDVLPNTNRESRPDVTEKTAVRPAQLIKPKAPIAQPPTDRMTATQRLQNRKIMEERKLAAEKEKADMEKKKLDESRQQQRDDMMRRKKEREEYEATRKRKELENAAASASASGPLRPSSAQEDNRKRKSSTMNLPPRPGSVNAVKRVATTASKAKLTSTGGSGNLNTSRNGVVASSSSLQVNKSSRIGTQIITPASNPNNPNALPKFPSSSKAIASSSSSTTLNSSSMMPSKPQNMSSKDLIRLEQQSRVQISQAMMEDSEIELPDIHSEYSDSDDESRKKKAETFPAWTASPQLNAQLAAQLHMNPDEIFGPIQPLSMEDVFTGHVHKTKFRARSSSANWGGSDRLTEAERLAYSKMMGFQNTAK